MENNGFSVISVLLAVIAIIILLLGHGSESTSTNVPASTKVVEEIITPAPTE